MKHRHTYKDKSFKAFCSSWLLWGGSFLSSAAVSDESSYLTAVFPSRQLTLMDHTLIISSLHAVLERGSILPDVGKPSLSLFCLSVSLSGLIIYFAHLLCLSWSNDENYVLANLWNERWQVNDNLFWNDKSHLVCINPQWSTSLVSFPPSSSYCTPSNFEWLFYKDTVAEQCPRPLQ